MEYNDEVIGHHTDWQESRRKVTFKWIWGHKVYDQETRFVQEHKEFSKMIQKTTYLKEIRVKCMHATATWWWEETTGRCKGTQMEILNSNLIMEIIKKILKITSEIEQRSKKSVMNFNIIVVGLLKHRKCTITHQIDSLKITRHK